jgi:hypothetical protein
MGDNFTFVLHNPGLRKYNKSPFIARGKCSSLNAAIVYQYWCVSLWNCSVDFIRQKRVISWNVPSIYVLRRAGSSLRLLLSCIATEATLFVGNSQKRVSEYVCCKAYCSQMKQLAYVQCCTGWRNCMCNSLFIRTSHFIYFVCDVFA